MGWRLVWEFKSELKLALKMDIKTVKYLDLVSALAVPARHII